MDRIKCIEYKNKYKTMDSILSILMEKKEYTYTTTKEYREVFRQITNQSTFSVVDAPNPHDIDEETLDELAYDEAAVGAFLEKMYLATRSHPLFQAIYGLAAAKMISTDCSIGMTVLLSYDYLWAFYPCYCDFINDSNWFDETNEWYIKTLELVQ